MVAGSGWSRVARLIRVLARWDKTALRPFLDTSSRVRSGGDVRYVVSDFVIYGIGAVTLILAVVAIARLFTL